MKRRIRKQLTCFDVPVQASKSEPPRRSVIRRGWIVMVGVVLLTLFTNRLSAQPTVKLIGNNIDVSSGSTVQRLSPSVAYNSANNEYMVVWFDLRNVATTGNDIFAQRLSAIGGLIGANIPIDTEVGA